MIKAATYVVLAILLLTALIKLVNVNIIINEMNNASSLAMENTQKIMKDIIIDKEFNIKSRESFYVNETGESISYSDYYLMCFKENVKDSSIYDLKIEADQDYGIIYVEIRNNYSSLIPTKKLLNIVEIIDK